MTKRKKNEIENFEFTPNEEIGIDSLCEEIKEEICRVLWIKLNSFAISFKGYGITIDGIIDKDIKSINLKYQGEIGESDFKILNY